MTAILKGFPNSVPSLVLPKSFHDHALEEYAHHVVAVETSTLHGVNIKLARLQNDMWRRDKMRINFFGKVISLSDHSVGHSIPKVEKTVALDIEKKAFREAMFSTFVLIDVHDTSRLKLKLPERDVLIQDEGLEAIWTAINHLYCKMVSDPHLVNGLACDHPLRKTSPYPIPAPAVSVSNLAGTRWIPQDGGLISAAGDRLELHDIVGVAVDTYGSQEGGYLPSMLEPLYGQGGCPEIMRILFEQNAIFQVFGEEHVSVVVGNTLVINAEGDELKVPLDDGESGYELNFSDVGESLKLAEIDDLLNTVVDDLALTFTIRNPHGNRRTLTVPIPAIYFDEHSDYYSPSLIIAKGREDDAVERLMRGVPWYNEEDDYDRQERSYRESYDLLVARITGQSRSHFRQKVHAAILDEAYSLSHDATGEDEIIAITVIVRLGKDGSRSVNIEPVQTPLLEAA